MWFVIVATLPMAFCTSPFILRLCYTYCTCWLVCTYHFLAVDKKQWTPTLTMCASSYAVRGKALSRDLQIILKTTLHGCQSWMSTSTWSLAGYVLMTYTTRFVWVCMWVCMYISISSVWVGCKVTYRCLGNIVAVFLA